MDYGNLRRKTPLDFTSDKDLLKDIGIDLDSAWDMNFLRTIDDTTRAEKLLDYAEHESVEDYDLRDAIYAEFDAELSARGFLSMPTPTEEEIRELERWVKSLYE